MRGPIASISILAPIAAAFLICSVVMLTTSNSEWVTTIRSQPASRAASTIASTSEGDAWPVQRMSFCWAQILATSRSAGNAVPAGPQWLWKSIRPSIGLTAGGGGGKTRTCAPAFAGRLPSAARPATPAAAVLRKSRRLPPSGGTSDARGVAGCPQAWPQQLMNRHRGSVNGFMGTLLVAAREWRIDADVDQVRAAARESALDSRSDLRRLLHALARNAQRPRHADEVDERLEVHPDVSIVLGGEALERARALLEDPVRRVVEDHVHDGERLAGRGPERLVRVHGAPVPDEREDGPVAERKLHAQRGREPPADATAAEAEEALPVGAAEEVAHALGGGDGFVHDHGVRRRAPRELVDERERRERHPGGLRLGALRERRALALPGGPHGGGPLARVRVALLASDPAHRLAELGERRLRIALDRHGGGIVLAELPRIDVEMDDREAWRHRVHVVGQREREEVAAHREEQVVAHEERPDRRARG